MNLQFDYTALAIATLFLCIVAFSWRYFFRRWSKPFLYFSDLPSYLLDRPSFKVRISQVPRLLLWSALISFLIAYIDPHFFYPKNSDHPSLQNRIPTEGIAIYLALDVSQSMLEQIVATMPNGEKKKISKIDILKDVTTEFVEGSAEDHLKGRPNDLIGIVAFSRTAQVLSPLTLDHQAIVTLLKNLKVNTDQSELGTVLGYAIFKSASLIEATRHFSEQNMGDADPAYSIKNFVIVLITDGFQEINPQDYQNALRSVELDEAVNYAKDLGIRLYMINIDPVITSAKYADYRQFFKLLTEMTGGKFFYLDSTTDLVSIYQEIDKLEKSSIPKIFDNKDLLPHLFQRISFYPYFIALGLFFLSLYVLIHTLFLRRVP